ncbi:MAG: hypothetical protein GX627_01160 [Parcubacteria group bacterium]|nr:hypothetical protein [Parcubacteria group bacterium]
MSRNTLDLENKAKCYLDEKELFILYSLYRQRRISTMWSNVFVPNNSERLHIPEDEEDKVKYFERQASEVYQRLNSKKQSAIVFSYLLELGKALDPEGFSLYCNADYALLDGGFLYDDDNHSLMWEYFQHILSDKKDIPDKKFEALTKEQKKAVEDCLLEENLKDGKVQFPSSLAYQPIKEYKEAILEKKADKDFIELVNKLITDYDGGRWNTEDVERFLEIWYRHNKEQFRQNALSEKTFLHEDAQTKIARLIFENADVHLSIKNTERLEQYLTDYIKRYKDDELDGKCRSGLTGSFFSSGLSIPLHTKMFGFKKQKDILLQHLKEQYDKYQRSDLEIGHPYIEPEYIGNDRTDGVKITLSETNEEQELFLFVHTMIALSYDKELVIKDFDYGTKGIFDLYDRGFLFQVKLTSNLFADDIRKEKVYFDAEKSVLIVNDKEIKVQKFNDQYHTLRIIFEEPNEEWFFSRISEKYDPSDNLPDKKFYNAIYQLNQKLKAKGIDDFFITTRQSVKINEKYLS